MCKIIIGLLLLILFGVIVYAIAPTFEILSPLNITYTNQNWVWFNWTGNSSTEDMYWYSLDDGINDTRISGGDLFIPDNYTCTGDVSVCSHSSDNNYGTYTTGLFVACDGITRSGIVFQNYSLLQNQLNLNYSAKFELWQRTAQVSCYNSSNEWVIFISYLGGVAETYTPTNISIPVSCLTNNKTLQLKTPVNYMCHLAPKYVYYYDSKITHPVGKYNTSLILTEGPHNITLYGNDTSNNVNSTTTYFTIAYPPTYSTNSTNDTHVGNSIKHILKWQDNTNLSGYIFSFNNGTGSFTNDTWVPMVGILNWSNVTKTVNNTLNITIQWKVYANDTYDNWNTSDTYSYITTNTLPTIGNPTINDSTPHTNDFLLCNNGSFSDADGDTATWFYRWYDTTILISGENTNNLNLSISGLDSGDTIICSTIASDGYENATAWVNSTSSTIQYTPITNTPTITPTTAYTNNNLLCNATITDSDVGNTLTAYYKWYLNGSLNETGSIIVTNNTNTLISTVLSGNTTKNDLWICEITPNDGVVNGTSINSTTKNISNSLPTQTPVTITPLPAETNDNLTCNHVYADADNDTESGVLYRWYINGILNVTTQNLSYTSTFLGDNIKCSVDVYDGYENSSWSNSSELTLGDTVAPVLHTQYLSETIGDINIVMTIGINVTEANDLYYVIVEITNPNDVKQNITMILDTNGGTEHYYTRQYTPQITGFFTFKFYSEDGSGNVATPLIGSSNYEARAVTEGTSGGGGGEPQIIILTGNWTIMQQNIYLVVASANVTSYITIDNKANTEIENIEVGCIPSTCVEDDPSSCVNVCNYVTFGEELIAIEDKPLLQAYQIQPGQSGKLPFTTDFTLDFALKNNLPIVAAGTYKYSITVKIDDVTRPVSVTVVNLPSISVLGDILNWIPNETVIIPGEKPFIIPNWLMLIILIILIIIVLAIIYRVLKKPKKKQFKQWW